MINLNTFWNTFWTIIKHKVDIVVEVGENKTEKKFEGKDYYNIPSLSFVEKLELSRIDLLILDSFIYPNYPILKYTDHIVFQCKDRTYEKELKDLGFEYIYKIEGDVYLAMRVNLERTSLPLPKLEIICINLERSTERRKNMKNQLDTLGFPYLICKAVDGNMVNVSQTKPEIEYKNSKLPYSPVKKLSYGELGCALSHYFSYKKMLSGKSDYFLILEDDITIENINLARHQLMNIPKVPFEMCFLSKSMNTQVPIRNKINDYYSYTDMKHFHLASSILFSRKGLEKVVSVIDRQGITLPTDDLLQSCDLEKITTTNRTYASNLENYKSDIWNVYKENESHLDVRYDKPVYDKLISMTTGEYSRLGNSMFQYALLKAQSLDKHMFINLTRIDTELRNYPNIDYYFCQKQPGIDIQETKFEYDSELVNKIDGKNNYHLTGYYQSYKYFEKYKDVIRNVFEVDKRIKKQALLEYVRLSERKEEIIEPNFKICGVQIRLPDTRGETDFIYTTPSISYIKEATTKLSDLEHLTPIRYFVCSNDIEDCKKRYSHLFPENTFYSERDKYFDITFLSICDYNIITAGAFGWWGAYLNRNPSKIVIAMSPNFNQDVERVKNNNEKDLYPPEWLILQN
jgi:GR25 family glycosyltransferase involved in LPS biosynthesis